MKIIHYNHIQSTNTTAYQMAEAGADEWTVIVADTQTRGKGRDGNRWESPIGGLWFTVILRPEFSVAKLPILQFFAALAVRDAIEEETRIHVQIKWPNDLVISTRKLGGILVESKTLGENVQFAAIGIGLNVNQEQIQLPKGATSLLIAREQPTDLRKLLKRITDQMRSKYRDLQDPPRIMKAWWENCSHRLLRVQISSPGDSIIGVTRRIGPNGSLIVQTEDGRSVRVDDGTLRVLDEITS